MSGPSKRKQFPFTTTATNSSIPSDSFNTDSEILGQKVFDHAHSKGRKLPNALVTGTPGTGKTTLCRLLARTAKYKHLEISGEIKKNKWYSSYDEEMDSFIFSDSKVRKGLSALLSSGGNIVDFHSVENIITPSLIDLVVVLRTNNTDLFDRLVERENVECEIMQVLLEEARETFSADVDVPIIELGSNTITEQRENFEKLAKTLKLD